MSAKTSADVLIGGKIYTLSGYESEDYLQKVANYINNKINEFDEMEQFRRFPGEMKATLVQLNIADDYFKAKEQAEKLEQDVREKEKEIYELKHELISVRITAESSEKSTTELEKENRKLLLHKAKLETALEDALLGKVKGQVPPPETSKPTESSKDQPKKKETGAVEHKNTKGGSAKKEKDSEKEQVIKEEKEEKTEKENHSV
ncbi:MAG: cell division protein ZapA [Lachnospiraceae bacterium]|nr:cell division protein ZapA [Lachnospiraceae bacterium]